MILDMQMDLKEGIGNKAKFLMQLKKNGFEVPGGFILSSEIFNEIVDFNDQRKNIDNSLLKLTKDNVKEISVEITGLVSGFIIPNHMIDDIAGRVNPDRKYAVRSSGTKEDLECLSFAGQYQSFLNVTGLEAIQEAIIHCYKSMYEDASLTYLVNNKVNLKNLEMAVIVQEMVNSEMSGIAFTMNPLTGNDQEIVLEVALGLGDNIVSGKVIPEKYCYNWFEEKFDYDNNNKLFNRVELKELMGIHLDIQIFFGYPCDIEFAYESGKLYILQARPITKIQYTKITEQWTTANFKDGGVSATVCKPYMWSLYEYIWETTLKKFLLETKLFKEKNLQKLGNLFYGRPYWNLSVVKEAMAKIPGYKEREFDSELGIRITYEGSGKTTKLTAKVLLEIIQIALAQGKLTKKQNANVAQSKEKLLNKYKTYKELDFDKIDCEAFEKVWVKFIKDDYLDSEGTYFWQIFINTIQQPLFKQSLSKVVESSGYLNLIGGLKNISHLLPFYDLWRISRKINEDQASVDFWLTSDSGKIESYYAQNHKEYCIPQLRNHIEEYGYHSDKELDVTFPCYCEDIGKVIQMIKDTIILDESFSPTHDAQKQSEYYNRQLDAIKVQVSTRKYLKLVNKIEKMRTMLWWREELKDISIKYYYLIRIYTLNLAKVYTEKGILQDLEDIWFLKMNDLFDYIENKDIEKLRNIIERNKIYYSSFRNFMSENEIGSVFNGESTHDSIHSDKILGIGCSNGTVTGIARVIENIDEMDKLQTGDILITKFTDTGWTSKFAILKGIVTECGGVLCHAAIVSREYGIPCIVSCYDSTKKIKDGSQITMNGATGEVIIVSEGGQLC